MAKSSVALTVLLVGLLLSAQSMTVFGRRGLWEAMVERNATMYNSTTVASVEESTEAEEKAPLTVEDTTADAASRYSPARAQMEQSGWSCNGGFTSQAHAWYCAGRSGL